MTTNPRLQTAKDAEPPNNDQLSTKIRQQFQFAKTDNISIQ